MESEDVFQERLHRDRVGGGLSAGQILIADSCKGSCGNVAAARFIATRRKLSLVKA